MCVVKMGRGREAVMPAWMINKEDDEGGRGGGGGGKEGKDERGDGNG